MIKIWQCCEMEMFMQHLQNWAGAYGRWGEPQATWSYPDPADPILLAILNDLLTTVTRP